MLCRLNAQGVESSSMKNFVSTFFLLSQLISAAPITKKEPSCPPLLNQTVRTIDGQMTNLCGFAGKTILVVNVASECGFTPQYKDLEALYKKYQTQNFVVLGFPSNDFMGQEPGSSAEIKAFAQKNFQISFPLFEKGAVTGNNTQAFYRALKNADKKKREPSWNFSKYLISKDAQRVEYFSSRTLPMDKEITSFIESDKN